MRRLIPLALLVCLSASAADRGYQFRVTRDPHGIKLTEGQGTHWKWVMIGCPTAKPDCEFTINDRGSGRPGNSDLGFVLKDENTVQMRCVRPGCAVKYALDDQDWQTKQMSNEETILIPMNARVAAVFRDE
ncbi:MAG TPA: hypothetical protein VII12_19210 [Thermoanaerobaculia bacterium]